jgi:hypothetical protein
VAEILQRFVKEKNLTANIKGKQYPLVEAWAFAGSQLGLFPFLTSTKCLSTDSEIKYEATVEIRRLSDNSVLSVGVALCSNKEGSKRLFDEYAILSMAQTRAVGKAFRMLLSWIMKAAGFEATPAEEMDFKNPEPAHQERKEPHDSDKEVLRQLLYSSNLNNEERAAAMTAIDMCPDYMLYDKIFHRLQDRQQGIDEITNPSQKDINKHLKKAVKK